MAASPRSATDSEGGGSERWQATPLDLMAALYAGFPDTVPLKTVNRQCSSVADVASAIKAELYDIGISAGLESMTVAQVSGQVNPKVELFAQARDCILPMGLTSENVAQCLGITRVEQDQAAVILVMVILPNHLQRSQPALFIIFSRT